MSSHPGSSSHEWMITDRGVQAAEEEDGKRWTTITIASSEVGGWPMAGHNLATTTWTTLFAQCHRYFGSKHSNSK